MYNDLYCSLVLNLYFKKCLTQYSPWLGTSLWMNAAAIPSGSQAFRKA